ncbi:MAG: Coenzyme F420 hydrogenase/dehydrogenase, beta subunit C-terminal domain [Eubacteriales bacterium]|nr:Coenzyme F420 hydrogenase/dehydrogenase, beta subunit C-terminal domain [Eubacteriales bacterium]
MNCLSLPYDKCTGCFACFNICAKKAITMYEDKDGFYYPKINQDLCIYCGLCHTSCPQANIDENNVSPTSIVTAFYGTNNNKETIKQSSSGGIFAPLAQYIIGEGGVVFGAAFNYSSMRLEHFSTDERPLEDLQKSKYVQSYIGATFQRVRAFLNSDRYVLFVGTPCQCAGLKHYLGNKEYKKLYLCDFICHGVPPMRLLKEHMSYLKVLKKSVSSIDFRPKLNSWIDFFIIKNDFKTLYKTRWQYDPYYYLFEKAITLRCSCYSCSYSRGYRETDITLADFWGYHRYNKSIYNKNGLSMIIAYSEKGKDILCKIQCGKVSLYEIENEYVESAFKGGKNNREDRDEFYKRLAIYGYKKTVKEYGFSLHNTVIKNTIDDCKIIVNKFIKK